MILETEPTAHFTQFLLLESIARSIWFQDGGLAAILLNNNPAAHIHLQLDSAGFPRLVDPLAFAEAVEQARRRQHERAVNEI